MEPEDIEREKFNGSLAKRQIRQYFPSSINCAIWYFAAVTLLFQLLAKHSSTALPCK